MTDTLDKLEAMCRTRNQVPSWLEIERLIAVARAAERMTQPGHGYESEGAAFDALVDALNALKDDAT